MDELLQRILNGEFEIQDDKTVSLDGGTISFSIKDAAGNIQRLFLDRRIRTTTPDVFYLNEHPGREGSIELGKNDELLAKIEAL